MQIIPKSSFTATPWKNGGGVTHEALREPHDAEFYRWRVSVADIGSSGPFSCFAGYQRILVLLAGDGVRLSFAEGTRRDLRQVGEVVEFDGATATQCELLKGNCTDFNLIVSNEIPRPVARVAVVQAPQPVTGEPGSARLLFAVRGSFLLTAGASEVVLAQWDLAVLAPGDERMLSPRLSAADAAPLMFFATLDDNRQPPR